MPELKELIFVYNAKSGLFNKATDFAHKIISSNTYDCNLCAITHGNFGAHKVWVDFIQSVKIPTRFLYKDEFGKIYSTIKGEFPAVLLKQNNSLTFILTAGQLNEIQDLNSLVDILKMKLENIPI